MAPWRFIFVLLLEVLIGVHSQLDSNGFLSIDCGIAANTSYEEGTTKYTYFSDDQFIDTGINAEIATSYITDDLPRAFITLRLFPNGTRNCYTLRNLTVGFKYLIRATFVYGNYDKTNTPPIFDIYLGVNFWDTIVTYPYYPEIIAIATANFFHVCLVNKGLGIPFISSLQLRQFNSEMYTNANATQSLIMTERTNLGPSNFFLRLRYPRDRYDRWWFTKSIPGTIEISTNSSIESHPEFETPSLIMQSAATYLSIKDTLSITWSSNSASTRFYVILHFAEIQNATSSREINVYSNGGSVLNQPYNFKWLKGEQVTTETSGYTRYNITIAADSNSTLPPLLNGYELYKIVPVIGVPTYSADVTAIDSIKEVYQIKKGWSGDPCAPKEYIWIGINCISNSSGIPRITALNLSSTGLTGSLSIYFGNLSALVSFNNIQSNWNLAEFLNLWDLSNNNLSGSLNSLDQLTALTFLDIRGNSMLSTTLPPGLQSRQQIGILTYRFGDFTLPPSPSPSPSSSSKKYIIIAIAVAVTLLIITIAIGTFFWLRRKNNQSDVPKSLVSSEPSSAATVPNIDHSFQFSFNNLKKITYDFTNTIGTGGFGHVYFGRLENGYQVAVKMRSEKSTQGAKEFLAEAKNLARVHHKNLVALVGYCIDDNCMALVYEYMQKGNLKQMLRAESAQPLTWKQRLRIGYESALGLEYLHEACNPPLIHRDVKTSNILLNANLEAKIADFGLSRAFTSNEITHVSTVVVGTTGYLDPEYYLYNRLTAKSDVYSFGVVLLEIITGRPPIEDPEEGDLTQWVRQKVLDGDIESIVDRKMQGNYDIDTVRKVTNLACQCTERNSSGRPTMSVVVSELKEVLNLELHRDGISNNSITDVSLDSAVEMASVRDEPAQGPIVR